MTAIHSDDVQRYLAATCGEVDVSGFKYLSSGFECDIYAFRLTLDAGAPHDYILRLYMGKDGADKLAVESRGLKQLYAAGYPVPQILVDEANESALGKPFIIMERLHGHALWGMLSTATADRERRLIDHFSELLAQLHCLDSQPFTDQAARYETNPMAILDDLLNSWRQSYIDFGVVGFLAVLDWLDAHKNDITVQPAVVHLDFHANNVFVQDDGRMSVIDWSQICVSDYRCDLSWTLMIMGDYGKTRWRDRILETYQHAVGRVVDDLDYFNVISYTKLIASTIISLQAGPEELGMRAETVETMRRQIESIRSVYQRVQAIAGVAVPEVESTLRPYE